MIEGFHKKLWFCETDETSLFSIYNASFSSNQTFNQRMLSRALFFLLKMGRCVWVYDGMVKIFTHRCAANFRVKIFQNPYLLTNVVEINRILLYAFHSETWKNDIFTTNAKKIKIASSKINKNIIFEILNQKLKKVASNFKICLCYHKIESQLCFHVIY